MRYEIDYEVRAMIEDYIKENYPDIKEEDICNVADYIMNRFDNADITCEEIKKMGIEKAFDMELPEDLTVYDSVELFDGKVATIISSSGYDDGYYWEYDAKFKIDNDIFTMDYRGSGSGWIETYHEIAKEGHSIKALSGVPHYDFSGSKSDIFNAIEEMYEAFIKSGAEKSFVSVDYNVDYENGKPTGEIKIDGQEPEEFYKGNNKETNRNSIDNFER